MVVVNSTVVFSGQWISSSGQSTTPLHQDVELIHILLLGQRIVFSGQGLQVQAQLLVNVLIKLSWLSHGGHFLGLQCSTPPNVHIHSEQSSFWKTLPTAYLK